MALAAIVAFAVIASQHLKNPTVPEKILMELSCTGAGNSNENCAIYRYTGLIPDKPSGLIQGCSDGWHPDGIGMCTQDGWHSEGDTLTCPNGKHRVAGSAQCIQDGWHSVGDGLACPDGQYRAAFNKCIRNGEHLVGEDGATCRDGWHRIGDTRKCAQDDTATTHFHPSVIIRNK